MHESLPVHGYKPQDSAAVQRVNNNKVLEETVLRVIDEHFAHGGCDNRWLHIAQTHIQQGFMALNRAVFQPKRVDLPEDHDTDTPF
jgi:hypothetical protein